MHANIFTAVFVLGITVLASSCRTIDETDSYTLANGMTVGEKWEFESCSRVGAETSEFPKEQEDQFVKDIVFADLKMAGDELTLTFTNEIGEAFTFASKKPQLVEGVRKVWSGKASLNNAVELDTVPMFIAVEINVDNDEQVRTIYTKTAIPKEYYEDNVRQAFEINRYNDEGSRLSAIVMKSQGEGAIDYVVTRTCGDGFGYKAAPNRQKAKNVEFPVELSI